jgi:hypothetical protein
MSVPPRSGSRVLSTTDVRIPGVRPPLPPVALLAAVVIAALAACGADGRTVSAPGSGRRHAAVPAHIETWAYDDSASAGWCNGGYGASRGLVRHWLTYAETNCGPHARKAETDCRSRRVSYCTVIQYFDAGKVWSRNPIRRAPTREDWWLHQLGFTDRGHRLKEVTPGAGTAYWLNQANRQAQRWIRKYLRSRYNSAGGLLMDDTGACRQTQFYGSGYASSEEIRTDAGVLAEHAELARALTHRNGKPFLQVDNGIQPNPFICTSLPLLDARRGVVGLVAEGSPWDYGFTGYYSSLLDVIAAVAARRHDFLVLLSYDRGGSDRARLVQEATMMLGYVPGHLVSWADLEQQNDHLSVWPEEGIYPADPVQSMTDPGGPGCLGGHGLICVKGGHNDLRVAVGVNTTDSGAGVFRREFRRCYDRRVLFGHCASIVNDTSVPVVVRRSWLRQSYGHEIGLKGGDVQSGGRIDLSGTTFTPGVTKIPADSAVLLGP